MSWHKLPPAAKRAFACAQIWRRGRPTLLLDPGQRSWVEQFRRGDSHGVWCIGRQRGKSFAALALACEHALNNPGSIIRYAAKTKDTARQIVTQTLEQLLQWCEQPPEIDEAHATVRWANGSMLTWAGTDAQSFDRLRGPRAHLIFLDEAAFYQDLEQVESALLPQLTTTQGKALYLSTPPESLGHPFVSRFRSAQASGCAAHSTVEDNPRLSQAQRDGILRRFAETHGMTSDEARASTYWRREYMAEFVAEESRAALPCWSPELAARVVVDGGRPQYFNAYVSLDWGFGDGHGALFAHYDFPRGKLVIEDALAMRGKTLSEWVPMVKAKESELWGVSRYEGTLFGARDWGHGLPEYMRREAKEAAPRQPYLRVGDDQMLVLAEVAIAHGMAVLPTKKDNKHMAIDALDSALRRGDIEIRPKAQQLVRQLYATVWNRQRTEWERGAEGHGELVDCFVAGTLIATPRGDVNIETLRRGDEVMTREGPRRVAVARMTHEKSPIWELKATNGATLRGTARHPVHTQFGWLPLSQLTDKCILTEWNNQRLSIGAGKDGDETQTGSSSPTGFITLKASGEKRPTSTAQSGRRPTGRFLRAITSTTSTVIRSIMKLAISLFFLRQSIWPNTCEASTAGSSPRGSQSLQPRGRPRSGTAQKRAGSGILDTLLRFGKTLSFESISARFAASSSSQRRRRWQHAESTAGQRQDGFLGLTTESSSVRSAGSCSSKTNTPEQRRVPVFVESVSQTGEEASVFNLSVDGTPEYFANGILVHNCLMYLHRNVSRNIDPRPRKTVDPFAELIAEHEGNDERSSWRKAMGF